MSEPTKIDRVMCLANTQSMVTSEVGRQDAKWGDQSHPNLSPTLSDRPGGATPERFAEDLEIPTASRAKFITNNAAHWGKQCWGYILQEEVSEAVEAAALEDTDALIEELIQVAAVAVNWVRDLRLKRDFG